MLSTVQVIAFAFDYSAKRLLAFQESLRQDALVREEMERRAKLRNLCKTRCARHDGQVGLILYTPSGQRTPW